MIHADDRGPQAWNGVHVTHQTTVAQLVDVDNVGPEGTLLAGFEMFRHAGESLDQLIRDARDGGQRVLAIGSGWALSKINITDGWLVNTKLLNGCYDIGERYFDAAYPAGTDGASYSPRPGCRSPSSTPTSSCARRRPRQAGAEGGRDRQRANDRGRRLRQHARLADRLRRDAGLRRRPARRHRQRPHAVDREGLQARTQRRLRRAARS